MKLRMIKRLTAALLCVALLAGIPALAVFEDDALPAIPAAPEVDAVVELPEWREETPLISEGLEVQAQPMSAAVFDVTVPTTLAIHMDAGGGITCGNIVITNNGTESVVVEDAQITALNGWTLVDYATTTFTDANKGQHKVALQLGSLDGSIAANGEQKTVGVAAKIPYQGAKSTHADIAQVILVLGVPVLDASIDWEYTISGDTITLTKYIGKSNDVVVHNKYAVDGEIYKTALGKSDNYVYNPSKYGPFAGSPKCSEITSITFEKDVQLPEIAGCMFSGCSGLTSIDAIRGLDISNITDMAGMFSHCSGLADIDALSNWDISKVTDIGGMFDDCPGLTSIDALSNWDVSKVTDMRALFYGCSGLTSVDAISDWDTGKVTDMCNLFFDCAGLTNIDTLTGWDTSNVKNMVGMFGNCSSLETLDLSSFDTSKLPVETDWTMHGMFSGCNKLQTLTLGSKFSFVRPSTNLNVAGLPTPSADYIPGADGYWYTADGTRYYSDEIPNNTAATYYAVNPAREPEWEVALTPPALILSIPELEIADGSKHRVTATLSDVRALDLIESLEEFVATFTYETDFSQCEFLTTEQQEILTDAMPDYETWNANHKAISQKLTSAMGEMFYFIPDNAIMTPDEILSIVLQVENKDKRPDPGSMEGIFFPMTVQSVTGKSVEEIEAMLNNGMSVYEVADQLRGKPFVPKATPKNNFFEIEIVNHAISWGKEDRLPNIRCEFDITWIGDTAGTSSYKIELTGSDLTAVGVVNSSYAAPTAASLESLSLNSFDGATYNSAPSLDQNPMSEAAPIHEPVQYTFTIFGPATVEIGYTATLGITKTPEDDAAISWTSSDETIATVDEFGVVTGIGAGEVTISAQVGETVCQWIMTVTDIPDAETDLECRAEADIPILARYTKEPPLAYSCGPYPIATSKSNTRRGTFV